MPSEWNVLRYDAVDSTMTVAAKLADAGCADRTVVVANRQSAGQGRLGRQWHSEAGLGMYLSLILRRQFPVGAFPGLTLAIGLAVQEAILEATSLRCDLRWPNDLLVGSKKCCGILVNLEGSAVIAGIGINVNHAAFPDELSDIATSLRIASGKEHSVEIVMHRVLRKIDDYCDLLVEAGMEPILRLFATASSYVAGRRVVVDQEKTSITGTTAGLDKNGFLLLKQDNGNTVTILAGGVRPLA
jgi:BirA family biotin operon repressor/biotin-[acetyl-CoA-carboxylase] ligase